MLHSRGIRQTADGGRHLVSSVGKNKQSNAMGGWQKKTLMAMCCYGDVVLFTKNEIKYTIFNETFLHQLLYVKCSFS